MNSKQFLESTTSGAIASVSTPVGKTQTRGKGVYPDEKGGNLLTGKKTNKKFANTVKESNEQGVSEAKLDEETGYNIVRSLVSEFNILTGGNKFHPIDYKNPGTRVWTRGDGARHRDPGYIFIDRDMNPNDQRKWHDEKVLGKFWEFLSNKGAKPIRDVAGEFSSSSYERAVVYNKQLFVLGDRAIKWGSVSRLKNSDVWRQKKDVSEAKLDEEDIIIVPGQGKRLKPGLITKAKDRTDHEVEMALSDLFQSAKNAKQVYELIKDIPETVGIEGWVQEKIIKASDYLNTVREYLEHKQIGQSMAEGYRIVPSINKERYSDRSQEGLEGPFRSRNGKVYYYDTKVGRAYDPDTDIYLDLEDIPMENTMHEDVAKNQSVDKLIKDNKINFRADMISKDREGNYVFRKGYFYRPSKMDPADWAEMISQKMKELGIDNTVIESDDIWKPFKGGASLKAQSHYLAKIRVNNSEPVSEGLGDDFSSFLQDLEKKSGIKGTIRKPGTPQQPKPAQAPAQAPATLSADEVTNLRAQLKDLEQKFDPEYQRSDDYSYWNKQNSLARQIGQIRKQLRVSGQQMDEGMAAKVGGAVALIAALWGGSEYAAKNAYENSPQLQKLTQYHARATQEGDEAKLREIEKRIKMQKDRLSLGKGEAMDADGKPIVPTYESSHEDELADLSKISDEELNHLVSILGRQQDERSLAAAARGKAELEKRNSGLKKESSIMRGIQNEQSDDWGSMSKSEFKRREMEHELGHEDNPRRYRSPKYNIKPKGMFFYNVPVGKETDASRAGLKQSKSGKWYGYQDNMFGKGRYWEPKNESVTENADKCPECSGKLVAESELNEEGNKDACYHKVKSRYKVWPSAYASGALVQCRKKGAKNWGNKSK
jgi:hypothetical protein